MIQNPGFLPDHPQSLTTCSLCYARYNPKISERSVHNFLSYLVHTHRQTNKNRQKHNLLGGGKYSANVLQSVGTGRGWQRDRTRLTRCQTSWSLRLVKVATTLPTTNPRGARTRTTSTSPEQSLPRQIYRWTRDTPTPKPYNARKPASSIGRSLASR